MAEQDEPVDTGLAGLSVTAAVTEPEVAPVQVPAVVPTQVPAALPSGWTLHKVAALVRDVAQEMYDEPFILTKHGLTSAQYDFLKLNPFFQRALEAETISWARADNVRNRLALEAAIAVEDALPVIAARLTKTNEPLADVVALLKVLSEMAGTIGAKAAQVQPGSGERFKIVINMGADTLERDAHPLIQVSTDPAPASPDQVQSLLTAAGNAAKI